MLRRPQVVSPSSPLQPSTVGRVALFFIASHTMQQVKRAAVNAEGYVLDPFSAEAVATHLKTVGEPLLKAFGASPPYAIFSDSLEAYGADWTPALPAEFLKRRGYDLLPHLPELVSGDTRIAESVRHDYGRTLTELVDENYLVQINTWAHDHHTKFRSQTYGEPAVSLSSQRLVDLPEGGRSAVAGVLDSSMGELGQSSLRQQRDVRRKLYLAALAGLSRHPARYESRSRH